MPTIRVAVCLDRLSSALPECLGVLGREVDDPIVAAAGLAPAELVALRQLAGRLAPGADVVEAAPGIAQARNAALAACGTEVIAYLDDDVAVARVAPGTAFRMGLGGRRPGHDRRPDRPALRRPTPAVARRRPPRCARPARLRDRSDGTGRAAAHLPRRQRQLPHGRAAGRRRVLAVTRRRSATGSRRSITPSASSPPPDGPRNIARSFGSSASSASANCAAAISPHAGCATAGAHSSSGRRRDVADALRNAASGAAGAGAALVRGDLATATDRAGRAAENAGALAAPIVAHRDLQPATDATPFRPSVPEPQRRLPRIPALRRASDAPRATALLYHRVAEVAHDPLGLAVSPADFVSHIDALGDRIVPLEQLASGDFPDGAVAITFDDGYADNLPALRNVGVPVTCSSRRATSPTAAGSGGTSWCASCTPQQATRPLTVALDGDVRTWPAHDAVQRELARRGLHGWLQVQTPERIESALAQVRAWAAAPDAEDPRPLTVDEVRELAKHVTIGAHGRRHVSLRWMTADVRRAEMQDSRANLARWIGHPPTAFSYPFGVPDRDVDDSVQQLARALGYTTAVVNASELVTPATHRSRFPASSHRRCAARNSLYDFLANSANRRDRRSRRSSSVAPHRLRVAISACHQGAKYPPPEPKGARSSPRTAQGGTHPHGQQLPSPVRPGPPTPTRRPRRRRGPRVRRRRRGPRRDRRPSRALRCAARRAARGRRPVDGPDREHAGRHRHLRARRRTDRGGLRRDVGTHTARRPRVRRERRPTAPTTLHRRRTTRSPRSPRRGRARAGRTRAAQAAAGSSATPRPDRSRSTPRRASRRASPASPSTACPARAPAGSTTSSSAST